MSSKMNTMTAISMAQDREICQKAGINNFITRPIVTYQLAAVPGNFLHAAIPAGEAMLLALCVLLKSAWRNRSSGGQAASRHR